MTLAIVLAGDPLSPALATMVNKHTHSRFSRGTVQNMVVIYEIVSGILSQILEFFKKNFLTQARVCENTKYLQQSKAFTWEIGLEDR